MALCQQSSTGVSVQNHYRIETFPDSCHTKTTSLLWFVFDRRRIAPHTAARQKTHRQRWKSWNSYIPTLRTQLQWPWRSKHNLTENTTSQKKGTTHRNVSPSVLWKVVFFSNVVFLQDVVVFSVICLVFWKHCRKTQKASRFSAETEGDSYIRTFPRTAQADFADFIFSGNESVILAPAEPPPTLPHSLFHSQFPSLWPEEDSHPSFSHSHSLCAFPFIQSTACTICIGTPRC